MKPWTLFYLTKKRKLPGQTHFVTFDTKYARVYSQHDYNWFTFSSTSVINCSGIWAAQMGLYHKIMSQTKSAAASGAVFF